MTLSSKTLLRLAALAVLACTATAQTPPPAPLLPIPTARQLAWQETETNLFVHFTVNTFTDREWGDGQEDPYIFNPPDLDVRQWVRVARDTGFEILILTAKHHDGFTLWPSRFTRHGVSSSPWKYGRGDVVGDLSRAAAEVGLKIGLYLSPWDRHEPTYGQNAAYNAFYMGQLQELLTQYGPLHEVWFDGAKGEDAPDMVYNFPAYRALVRQLQPEAVMFSDEGPDVRWIGNERGHAGETNWSTIDRTKVTVGGHGQEKYLNEGEMGASDWVPGECDVSIRRGWFWHPDQSPKSVEELLDIYFKSVGRNCVLLLNVPPDTRGLFPREDVDTLYAFRAALNRIFDVDLALHATASASSTRGNDPTFGADQVLDHETRTFWATDDGVTEGWIELDLGRPVTFNVVRVQEAIALGQRIARHRVEVRNDPVLPWTPIAAGTTIGYKWLHRIPDTTARFVRLVVDEALASPTVAEFGLHRE